MFASQISNCLLTSGVGKKWLILGGAILLLAGILALGMLLPHNQPPQSVTLPSGATFTFAEASFGKKRIILPNHTWQRKVAFLPDSLLKFLKIDPGMPYPMQSNQLVIWLYVTPPGAVDLFKPVTSPFSVVDENGAECTAPNFLPYSFPNYGGPKGSTLVGLGLTAFPRRAREFRLRFYSRESNLHPMFLRGEMKIGNPAYRKYPDWQPEPLPATKTDGQVAITLTKLLTETGMFSSEPADTNKESWGQACFILTQGGKPSRDWAVDNVDFSDATGNHTSPAEWADHYDEPKPGEHVFSFGMPLWPSESAWKLDVTLHRTPSAKFAPGELWSMTNLALPALNSTNVLNLQTNLNGVGLGFQSLADESGMLPAENRSNYHRIRLIFQIPPLPPNVRFDVLSVTGHETSTNAHPRDLRADPAGTMGDNEFFYVLPASAQRLDVKIGVYRQLTAEFVVKPTIVQRSNSVSKAE